MSYYESRKDALDDIRTLAKEGNSLEDIQFHILEQYGFSKKFVEEYYNELKERGFLKKRPKKK